MEIVMQSIGVVRSPESGPREHHWGGVISEVHLDAKLFSADALLGLKEFSHVEVIFSFDRIKEEAVVRGTRHPRNNPQWPKVGIFAQRGKDRPNRIGATICRVLSAENLTVKVQGLDAFDGTPVLDLKPVMAEFIPVRNHVRQPQWSRELMSDYFSD